MKKLELLLGTLSGSRECRRGSDDLQRGVRQRARGPKREHLPREEVDSRTGLRGQTPGFLSQTLSKLADWAWGLLLCYGMWGALSPLPARSAPSSGCEG